MQPNRGMPSSFSCPGWVRPWGEEIRMIEAGYPDLKITRPILLVGVVLLGTLTLALVWVMILGAIFEAPFNRSATALLNGGMLALAMLAVMASLLLCVRTARRHRALQESAADALVKRLLQAQDAINVPADILARYILLDSMEAYRLRLGSSNRGAVAKIKRSHPVLVGILTAVIGKEGNGLQAMLESIRGERPAYEAKGDEMSARPRTARQTASSRAPGMSITPDVIHGELHKPGMPTAQAILVRQQHIDDVKRQLSDPTPDQAEIDVIIAISTYLVAVLGLQPHEASSVAAEIHRRSVTKRLRRASEAGVGGGPDWEVPVLMVAWPK